MGMVRLVVIVTSQVTEAPITVLWGEIDEEVKAAAVAVIASAEEVVVDSRSEPEEV